MPGHRHSASQGGYYPDMSGHHGLPLTVSQQQISQAYYADISSADMQSQAYATGGPVQQPQLQSYQPITQQPPLPTRPSSGAWNPLDDQTLMTARAQGMNWAPIQQTYFPNKTPNACRKRHERLMERKNADDWDVIKFENIARTYMGMRKEIWGPLAERTGEKWHVVEQKCMSTGLKNIQTAARSATRRERMNDGLGQAMAPGAYAVEPHTDDSSLSIDELEAEYDADGASSTHSGGSVGMSMAVPQSHHYHQGHHQQHHHQGHQQYHHSQRLPSMDMGIESIINRPPRSSGGR
ncbi:hypothetical protein F5884DRAFT_227881 [Xylogone sp. PMI_703]|nr:hypothetical protein F5884DRAFT_227881 [Xylogone sp. PMI_703]